jgi:Flp pilus assembly protein TadD
MKTIALMGVLAGAVFLSYRHTLSGEFIYDDRPIIVQNPLIQSLDRIPQLFGTAYWSRGESNLRAVKGGLYRPLTLLTFALNYRLGGIDSRGYHTVNLLLHFGVCVLVWILSKRLGLSTEGAAAAAILFAVLPIHTEAVTNIVGRSELLAAFFILLSWILVFQDGSLFLVTGGLVCFVLALLSKENSAAFLPVLIASDYVVRRQSWKDLLKSRGLLWIAYGGAILLFLEWRYCILGSATNAGGIPYFLFRDHLTIAFTMAKFTVLHYLKPLVLGTGLCADYTRPALPDAGVRAPSSWAYVFLLSGLLGSALYATFKKRSLPALAAIILLGMLLPVCNLFVPVEVIGAERFLYFPSIGYCLFLGLGLDAARRSNRRLSAAMIGLLAALVLWYGWQTFQRNKIWRTEAAFWQATLRDAPRSPRAWNGAGLVLMHQGKFDEAIEYFKTALVLNPLLGEASYNMAECHFFKHEFPEAKSGFSQLLETKPDERDALMYLAVIAEQEHDFKTAGSYYGRVLKVNPSDRTARRNQALLYCRTGNVPGCRSELESYLRDALPGEQNGDLQGFLMKLPG